MICLVRFHIGVEIHRLLLHAGVFEVRTSNTRILEFPRVPADSIHALKSYSLIRQKQGIYRDISILS
jgi:hypothetical protein